MSEQILITGATGFIGCALIRHLLQQGKHITVVTRPNSSPTDSRSRNITWTGDAKDLVDQVADANPDVVFHLASNFIAHHESGDIPELIDANITFGTAILEAAQGAGARVILTGSAWQHFEGSTYYPVSLYAATKQALFDIAVFYANAGLDVRELTLYDTYGPEDPRKKLVPLLLEAAATGKSIDMSSGMQLIDLLYVTDVVEALLRTADQPASELTSLQQFVARSGKPVSIRALVGLIEQTVGKEIKVEWGKRPDRPREMRSDWTFGHLVPGWSPRIDLASGIRACWTARQT